MNKGKNTTEKNNSCHFQFNTVLSQTRNARK